MGPDVEGGTPKLLRLLVVEDATEKEPPVPPPCEAATTAAGLEAEPELTLRLLLLSSIPLSPGMRNEPDRPLLRDGSPAATPAAPSALCCLCEA